jgi:hypothetical protein
MMSVPTPANANTNDSQQVQQVEPVDDQQQVQPDYFQQQQLYQPQEQVGGSSSST